MDFTTLGSLIEKHGGVIQTGPFGSQLHQHEYVENGIPVIMPKDIQNGRVDESTVARISEQKAQELSRHILKAGSIVFPRRGEINKCAYISEAQAGFLCGTGCLKIEVPSDILSPKFLFYYLGLRHVVEWLEKNAVGTTMLNLNTSIVGGLSVPLIDKNQQDRIVDILSAYDDLIENNRRRIDLLEQSARMLYKEWFVSLCFPGHEHVKVKDGVPQGWDQAPLDSVAKIRNGFAFKSEEYTTEGVQVVRTRDFSSTKFIQRSEDIRISENSLDKYDSYLLKPFDFLLIMVGASLGKYGVVMKKDLPALQNQNMWAIYTKDENLVPQLFLVELLQELIPQFINFRVGAAREFFRKDFVGKQTIAIPPVALVQAFNENITPLYSQISVLLETNERLQKARDLLLPRLMNGEIPV